MKHIGPLSALGVAGALVSLSTASFAADTTVVQAPPPPAPAPVVQPGVVEAQGAERPVETRPNVPLITTGLLTFGLSYVPALVVAGESSQSADHNLYIPVAGPWLDIANRPGCGAGGPSCTTETTNKVLIGVDGVFQGVGAVMTVLGLVTPETHTAAAAQAEKPSIHVSPTSVGSGYGLGAVGTW
jgi:outer membrane autotransporter protein